MNQNDQTLDSYNQAAQLYEQTAPPVVDGNHKEWVDTALSFLAPGATILEIGSGSGRDAKYMEAKGFAVQCTEASDGLFDLLHERGLSAQKLNLLTDIIDGTYSMIFTSAVFHHFPESDCDAVLHKLRDGLDPGGILALSTKWGQGNFWEDQRLGKPRFFQLWDVEPLVHLLSSVGFDILRLRSQLTSARSPSELWIDVVARRA